MPAMDSIAATTSATPCTYVRDRSRIVRVPGKVRKGGCCGSHGSRDRSDQVHGAHQPEASATVPPYVTTNARLACSSTATSTGFTLTPMVCTTAPLRTSSALTLWPSSLTTNAWPLRASTATVPGDVLSAMVCSTVPDRASSTLMLLSPLLTTRTCLVPASTATCIGTWPTRKVRRTPPLR